MRKRKERKRKMYIVFGCILVLIGLVVIWFHIPYSSTKNEFKRDVEVLMNHAKDNKGEVFTEEDFKDFPIPIQRYIEASGYIGKNKMSYMKMEYVDIDFKQGLNGLNLKIDYTQYNFVDGVSRLAFIDSSMFGIPFEGYDSYQNGKGGMKGVIGKAITIFNEIGPEMDKACLVTFLAESLFMPSVLLEEYIALETIDDYHVRANIAYEGHEASGIFQFNENYEMVSFRTDDRAIVNTDGTIEYVPWSAICGDYKQYENGLNLPTKFQAVWNYPDGDFVYFDGVINTISYGE